jgi:Tfp pilus assembly protein PilE
MNKFLMTLVELVVFVLVAVLLSWLAVQFLREWAAPPPLLF